MSKYIPPSRRPGYVPPTSSTLPPGYIPTPSGSYTVPELSSQFDHLQNSTLTLFNYNIPSWLAASHTDTTPYVAAHQPEDTPPPSSPPPPPLQHPLSNLVSYVVIFHNAHPAWESQHQLWMHTNAATLMEDFASGKKKNFGRPIPLFGACRGRKDRVEFQGWYLIDSFEKVDAGSEELKRMLKIKEDAKGYSRSGRTAAAWNESLSVTWVKLNLTKAPAASAYYTELKNPMKLPGGPNGEVAKYLLQVGGLTEELGILEAMKKEQT